MDDKLKSYVDRFVNLLEEAEANRADQKELAGEIKDDGLTPATVKKLAALAISEKKVARLKTSNEDLALSSASEIEAELQRRLPPDDPELLKLMKKR